MKIFRLLAASLLVAVCAGFSSCGDDELEEHQTEVMFIDGDSFSTYGLNFRDYECYGSFHWGNINHFSGLKNNHHGLVLMIGRLKKNFGNGLIIELLTKNVQFMLDMENIRILKYQALPPMELAPRTTSSLRVSVIMVSHTMKIISCSKQQQERSKK